MKKVLSVIIALVLSVGLMMSVSACGLFDNPPDGGEVDMTKYPEKLEQWSSQNILDYFTEAGVFTNKSYRYTQDHATYYSGTPINEGVGYMDDSGLITICIFTFDTSTEDEDVAALMDYIRQNKKMPDEFGGYIIDHMVGNLAFFYNFTVEEEVLEAMEAAYSKLVEALGVTPDF